MIVIWRQGVEVGVTGRARVPVTVCAWWGVGHITRQTDGCMDVGGGGGVRKRFGLQGGGGLPTYMALVWGSSMCLVLVGTPTNPFTCAPPAHPNAPKKNYSHAPCHSVSHARPVTPSHTRALSLRLARAPCHSVSHARPVTPSHPYPPARLQPCHRRHPVPPPRLSSCLLRRNATTRRANWTYCLRLKSTQSRAPPCSTPSTCCATWRACRCGGAWRASGSGARACEGVRCALGYSMGVCAWRATMLHPINVLRNLACMQVIASARPGSRKCRVCVFPHGLGPASVECVFWGRSCTARQLDPHVRGWGIRLGQAACVDQNMRFNP
eukprot:364968-Chlamydomonas_euryale.AAC.13